MIVHEIVYSDLLRLWSSHSYWSVGRRDFSTDSDHKPLRTLLQLTRISCKSSRNVCRQVFLGRPLLLLPPSGSRCIATLAGLSDGSRSMPCQRNLLTLTIFYKSSIPALFINSSLVMWSCEMPNMVRKHLRWKTSNIRKILVSSRTTLYRVFESFLCAASCASSSCLLSTVVCLFCSFSLPHCLIVCIHHQPFSTLLSLLFDLLST